MKPKRLVKSNILFTFWFALSVWGLLNLFSASSIELMQLGASPFAYVKQNLVIFLFGLVIYFGTRRLYMIPYKLVTKNAKLINYIIMLLLFLVLIIGVSKDNNLGARSIFSLGPINIQPMEFYKVSMILYFSSYFAKLPSDDRFDYYLRGIMTCALGIFLVVIEPDLGGALILSVLLVGLILIVGEYIPKILKWSLPIIFGGILIMFLMIQTGILHAYQISRLSTWLNPFENEMGSGLQIIQSLIAISNGGLSGAGFLNSVQKTSILPYPESDAIFSIMLEEWGILALIITVGLILAIAVTCFAIGFDSEKRSDEIYCYGIGILFLTQTLVNIGGITNTIPLTGVTLPLISYGRNSYLTLMLGLLFVVIIDRVNEKRRRERHDKINRTNIQAY